MKKKFELKCAKVKGICFHPTRPNLVVLGLFNGEIQIWDFVARQMISKLQDEDYCVRSVHFHPTQALVVSGGDDFLIKGWNYVEQKTMFELRGHSDYLRTVEFHNELPWILSASDDQTLRLWNWQSKSQISVVTGHSHYVMCATFHPTKNLIASCSLDSTFRIWDYSKLREKFSSSTSSNFYALVNDVECLMTVEAHVKGINWISFHPKDPLLLTCSDDKLIKLWKYTETNAYEQQTFHGHSGNVSIARFFRDTEFVLSNSEDFSLRLWDQSGLSIEKVVREDERQWMLDVHPTLPLVGTGTDKSFAVMSLFPSRLAYDSLRQRHVVFYSNEEATLKYLDFDDCLVVNLDQTPSNPSRRFDFIRARRLQLNPNISNQKTYGWLKLMDDEKKIYYFQIRLNKKTCKNPSSTPGQEAVFVAKDKMIVRDKTQIYSLSLDSGHKNSLKHVALNGKVQSIFEGPVGKCFILTEGRLVYYDFVSKKEIGQIEDDFSHLKRLAWNRRKSFFVIQNGKWLLVFDKRLKLRARRKEDSPLVSWLWTEDNFLLFNTYSHLKYLLLNGESGVIKSLDQRMFLLGKQGDSLITVDLEENIDETDLDFTDLELKNALLMGDLAKVKKVVKEKKVLGNSLTGFLLGKGYSSLALQLTKDKEIGFFLALDAGNLETAFNISRELNSAEKYRLLAAEAMKLGCPSLADMCLSLAGGGHRHLMHSVITGNREKVEGFTGQDITQRFNNSLFSGNIRERIKALSEAGQLALAYAAAKSYGVVDYVQYLGQAVPDLVKLVDQEEDTYWADEMDQEMQNMIDEVYAEAKDETSESPKSGEAQSDKSESLDSKTRGPECLIPAYPLVKNYTRSVKIMDNWPLYDVPEDREIFHIDEDKEDSQAENFDDAGDIADDLDNKPDLGIIGGEYDPKELSSKTPKVENPEDEEEEEEDLWGISDDSIDFGEDEDENNKKLDESDNSSSEDSDSRPKVDVFIQKEDREWTRVKNKSLVAWEKMSIGDFEIAAELLKTQTGVNDVQPLQEIISETSLGSEVFIGGFLPCSGSVGQMIYNEETPKSEEAETYNEGRLFNKFSLSLLQRKYQQAMDLIKAKKLETAKKRFKALLQASVLTRLETKDEIVELESMVTHWKDYILMCSAMSMLPKTKNKKRKVELSLIMASCRLEDVHKALVLQPAAATLYKTGNYVHCLYVLRKFLTLVEANKGLTTTKNLAKMKKMLANCEAKGGNKIGFEFQERFLYNEEEVLMTADYEGVTFGLEDKFDVVECPLDGASFRDEKRGMVCPVCELCELGFDAVGLKRF